VPTMIAVGVAKPRAHGHAIASTVMEYSKAIRMISSQFVPPF
jgi:hypothetical protein